MPETEFDVAILGAGPVGCALALALRGSGLRVALAGRKPGAGSQALRPIALSYASRLILERLGAWDGLPVTPIEQIHVSQSGAFGRTRISREDLGLPALGYVAGYDAIAGHLAGHVDAGIWRPAEAAVPTARLVVHAEGTAGADAIEKDYGRSAIVTVVASEHPAPRTAWERFTSEGPLALLPLGSGYGVVWSRATAAASASADASDAQFLAELQEAFGMRAGRFRTVGPRAAIPLVLRYSAVRAKPGEVRIGNAAQTLHPVAGQGLNLGLRDAWALARQLRDAPAGALGSADQAQRFIRARRLDAQATIRATDLLATLYVRRDPVAAALRGAALAALDVFPPARKAFASRMIYGASAW
ncbi:MAG: FAD-dependent monooxygenase [Proteobacteria bacterium]|nr:FAD-dependent monooxygenase [Pseudomonadota bacterium]